MPYPVFMNPTPPTPAERLKSIVIPHAQLSAEALNGLIEEFILREGTDYGLHEYTLEQKNLQISKQLKSGQIVVVFDPNEETCSIVRKEELSKLT